MNCALCADLGCEQDHPDYPNPEMGDQHHGQYDPAHPELIDAALRDGFCVCWFGPADGDGRCRRCGLRTI